MEFFNLHTHQNSGSEHVLELLNQYPLQFNKDVMSYSIGIHPWYVNANSLKDELEMIEGKLKETNCLAVGECGLDKRIDIVFDLQQSAFESQLLLAQMYNKPVVIHCVAAFQELIAIRKKLNIKVPLIIHGYSKNSQLSKDLINNGFYLSFGKQLMLKPEIGIVFADISNDRFFLETDTSSFAIEEVYEIAAKHKNCSLEQLKQQIKSNFASVFEKPL